MTPAEKELIKAVRAVLRKAWGKGIVDYGYAAKYNVPLKEMKALRVALRAWDKEQRNDKQNT